MSSTHETECVAHNGGHDGHLADVEALRHHVATTIGATLMDRRCDATLSAGNKKKDDVSIYLVVVLLHGEYGEIEMEYVYSTGIHGP